MNDLVFYQVMEASLVPVQHSVLHFPLEARVYLSSSTSYLLWVLLSYDEPDETSV